MRQVPVAARLRPPEASESIAPNHASRKGADAWSCRNAAKSYVHATDARTNVSPRLRQAVAFRSRWLWPVRLNCAAHVGQGGATEGPTGSQRTYSGRAAVAWRVLLESTISHIDRKPRDGVFGEPDILNGYHSTALICAELPGDWVETTLTKPSRFLRPPSSSVASRPYFGGPSHQRCRDEIATADKYKEDAHDCIRHIIRRNGK